MSPPAHRYNGARSLIILHERHLREFVETWRRGQAASLTLPTTTDPSYASMQSLLRHVLRAARGYMVWICEMLELPAPAIEATPEEADIEAAADRYVDHLTQRWATQLVDVEEAHFEDREYRARWGTLFSIDAMMEHAVMHPIRHEYQLRVLLGESDA